MFPETEKMLKYVKTLGESKRIDETQLHSIKLLYSKIHRKLHPQWNTLTSTKNHQTDLYNTKIFKDLKLRRRLNSGESEANAKILKQTSQNWKIKFRSTI